MSKHRVSTLDIDEWLSEVDGEEMRDLESENALLRQQLRLAFALKDHKIPAVPNDYGRKKSKTPRRFIVIPDTQVRPGVGTDHLEWAGKYIAEKRPDVVIHLGDHWDFPSLSSHDSDVAKAFNGVAYSDDIAAGNAAMKRLTAEYRGIKGYKPEEHFLVGNHEDRQRRTLEALPFLRGLVKFEDLDLTGWRVHPFLETVELEGVLFSHYFANPLTGRSVGGTAHNLLKVVGKSCVQGHRQTLDCAIQELPDGSQRRATIVGCFYSHAETYKTPQGNGHFRGIIVMNEVQDGMWDQSEVSLGFLKRKYG